MASPVVTSFLSALQAAVSVLLTISYGVIAAQFKLINESSSRDISKMCVRLFMPALLITNVGSELHAGTAIRYVPILIWSLIYNFGSMGVAFGLKRLFRFPSWFVPAVSFNNTTSLPLLLVKSLSATGILETLITDPNDTLEDAVRRAQSYFLVNAVVGNVLTFSLGPKLLDCEEVSDSHHNTKEGASVQERDNGSEDVEQGQGEENGHQQDNIADEQTSLLPNLLRRQGEAAGHVAYQKAAKGIHHLPFWTQRAVGFSYAFLNAPMIGAVIGAIIGLAPPLHRAFFNPTEEGGIFKAWLTSSLENIGGLFATLQVVVVGVKLSSCLRRMKEGEETGSMPWFAAGSVLVIRFVVWPVISILLIPLILTRSSTIHNDPILWFSLMLMPTGPPALKLTALADVNDSSEAEKLTIAKFITLSYILSPAIAFAVVGSLRACEEVLKTKG